MRFLPWRGRQGQPELSAPNLTDAIWLYGSGEEAILRRWYDSQAGRHTSLGARLGDVRESELAVFVRYRWSGGE